MNPTDLGDSLARLVWESFTDFIEHGGIAQDDVVPEEVLILFLWIHTRVCQQAFGGRADPELVRAVLDEMHRAVFEDMEAHGTPRGQLPLFEQRVSARYAEYYAAADGQEETVGELAARYVSGKGDAAPVLSAALAEATAVAAGPLRDFLEDVVLAH